MTASVPSPAPTLASTSDRTHLRVHPERSAPDEVAGILRDGLVAHIAVADDAGPVVIPMTYALDEVRPGTIYVHGAHHSRLMQHVASGKPVCVSVTLVDGLVYSRTALYHSVNYRSAVCFGTARVVDDPEEQMRASLALMLRYFPGRTEGVDFDPIPEEHLRGTSYVAIEVTDASAKVRRGGPKGPRDQDPTAPGTAGVLVFDPPR
ncbi:MAG TPA: pyridoxamine 5'-phosphate oxidase family protein [Gemmatimonadaceae bacterium]|jgi:nitroimidazol reductase NimA-like FMN-containing flavoprotein (pyridoxamine 5'-phosphate oxidase superfamily)|nr:pyridoxamine 5'-phosphate oxidase family protein [Gemmatimonadota bacterium]MBP9107586.1 pyridoxamine 5'-phosphate oxidase family protein [Gemmatimonadaceae bacterium]MBK8647642.1 pyridoxamine 5'-phosphate oxidase family protein [Gemmatimonadota bacterium]MBK9408764.1 pyridoxamine 5'-phosphate oxidase family protein [Gemmatimonadota bacterium]MBK9978057.1 pyridoxamine 5'-phosphate oxidase family protein [Gemmatimonadota bacterium]